MCQDPPVVDETDYGYDRNPEEKTLDPTTLPPGVSIIPPEVQKILCCNCKANEPCGKGNCTCRLGGISCTIFCACYSLGTCKNPHTVNPDESDNQEDSREPDESDS